MHWNHRILKTVVDGEVSYGIHEVFYDDDGSLMGCSEEPIGIVSETIEGCRRDLKLMETAFKKPVLEKKIFEDMEEKDDTILDS